MIEHLLTYASSGFDRHSPSSTTKKGKQPGDENGSKGKEPGEEDVAMIQQRWSLEHVSK